MLSFGPSFSSPAVAGSFSGDDFFAVGTRVGDVFALVHHARNPTHEEQAETVISSES